MLNLYNKKWPQIPFPRVIIYLIVCLVIYKCWIDFHLPFDVLSNIILPIMICLLILVIILSITIWKGDKLRVSVPLVCTLILSIIILTQISGMYSRQYKSSLVSNFIQKLGIKVSLITEEHVPVIFSDIGPPPHVIATYELNEPKEIIESKIRRHLREEVGWLIWDTQSILDFQSDRIILPTGWSIVKDQFRDIPLNNISLGETGFIARCDLKRLNLSDYSPFFLDTLIIDENEQLIIILYYVNFEECHWRLSTTKIDDT